MKHFKMEKNFENQVRLILAVIAALMVLIYIGNRMMLYHSFDRSYPEITMDQEVLEVSVTAEKSAFLEGVKAFDKKDGDVTDTLIVESISKMLPSGERILTLAAFDKDDHVGKAERRIRYTDYVSPRFSLEEPLDMQSLTSSASDIFHALHAVDCIDGDLTDQIVVVSTDISNFSLEVMEAVYEVQVTNSCGDVSTLKIPLEVQLSGENVTGRRGEILLTEYLIYTKTGVMPQFRDYVESVTVGSQEFSAGDLKQDVSELDLMQPGVYTVTYTLEQEDAYASVKLLVVVEE